MMDEFYNNFHEFNEATKTELVNFIKSKTTAWISMSNSFELVSSCSTKELQLENTDDETKEDGNEGLKNMIKKQLKNSVKVATTSMLSERFMKFLENDFEKPHGSFQHFGSDNQKYDQPLSELLEKAFSTLPNGKFVVIAVNDDPRAKDNRFMTTKRLEFVK